MSASRRFLILLGAFVLIVGCSPTDMAATTTSEFPASSVTSTTSEPSTTSLAPAATSTTIHETTTSSVREVTTTVPATVSVEDVVAVIQSELDEEFAATEPAEGVLGAYQVQCTDSGPVDVGDVLACAGTPNTEPDFQLDPVGVLIYVIDDEPTVAWLSGTDVPDTTDHLHTLYEDTPKGLFCRDLLTDDPSTWFDGYGTVPTTGYFLSLVYWSLEGQPDRMDADRNGIPCETQWPADVIEDVLDGGRLH